MTIGTLRSGPVAAAIRRHRLVVTLDRVDPPAGRLALVAELADAGVRVFEVPFDGATADDDLVAIRALLDARLDGPFLVGAAGIVRRGQLEAARRARADFATSPLFDRELVQASTSEHLPFLPGAFTPTEIEAAWAAGATLVTLFPAVSAGPPFIRELRGRMPDVELIASGGLDADDASDYLGAGAAAVALRPSQLPADGGTRRERVAAIGGRAPAAAAR